MFGRNILKDEHVEPLAEGVLDVLEEVGILCQNEEIIGALEAAGAKVDFISQRVKFPREIVRRFVEDLREECAGYDYRGDVYSPPGLGTVSGQVAQFCYDDERGESRSANTADFIMLTKFGDALHGDSGVGHSLSLTDVPPLLEPLEAGLLLAEYAHEPHAPFAWNVRQINYLIEMGEILGRTNWVSYGAICFAHPLRFDKDTADRFVRRAREGISTGLTAMPVAGATTPVTLEGFIVVSSAEHVATWLAARALNPAVPLSGSMWAGTVDMKSGAVSYSAFDAMIYGFAAVEFLRRWTGMLVPVGAGEYCEARVPGLYTALEKAYKALLASAFTGQPMSSGTGLIDNGRTLSAVQLLLDRDFAVGLQQYARQIHPTPENIALPTISQVGVGLSTSFLVSEHTLQHFRHSLWLPEFIDRAGWNGCGDEEKVLAKARAKVRELLAQYQKPEGREEQLEAMRAVRDRARRELLA